MKCHNCQAEVRSGMFFCERCGTNISKPPPLSAESSPPPTPFQASSARVPPPPPPQPKAAPAAPLPSPAQPQVASASIPQTQVSTTDEKVKPLGVGKYIFMLLVFSVPIFNIIMMSIWAFSSKNKNQKNFAIAALLWLVVLIVLAVLFSAVLGSLFWFIFDITQM